MVTDSRPTGLLVCFTEGPKDPNYLTIGYRGNSVLEIVIQVLGRYLIVGYLHLQGGSNWTYGCGFEAYPSCHLGFLDLSPCCHSTSISWLVCGRRPTESSRGPIPIKAEGHVKNKGNKPEYTSILFRSWGLRNTVILE